MFKALLNNEIVYSLDIRSVFGEKDDKLESKLRAASNSNLLRCTACNNIVILKSGDIKVPHFAHKEENNLCELYNSSFSFSEQHSKGVHFIYSYLKKFYSNFNIFLDYKFSNNEIADIYFSSNTKSIVFEYINNTQTFYNCIPKSQIYKDIEQKVIWIFSLALLERFIKHDFIFYFNLENFSNEDKVVTFLNPENYSITFFKYYNNNSYRIIPIYNTYKVTELLKYSKNIFSSELFLKYFSKKI